MLHFEPGFGAAASLDWGIFQFANKFSAGLALSGGYGALSIADGSSFSLTEGAAGPFVNYRIADRISVQVGADAGIYRYQWGEKSNTRFRAGAVLTADVHLLPYLSLYASGGYTWHSFAENAPFNAVTAGLGVRLNIGELLRPRARVTGEKSEQRQVFPVSYAWYEKNSIATVSVFNNEPNAITDVSLSFYLERYMNQPTTFGTVPRLLPGERIEIPVTALFNESMLSLLENITASARVAVDYRSLGARKRADFALEMPVYHRNAMSWDDDRRASSCVSARDPAAVYFARYVESALRSRMVSGVPPNVQYAAALFETLNVYGMNYVIDPASSYIDLSENASALDSLNYPYQTLFYRGGDCDDLSILFCSLLEVLGIETAFITIPGHIYMAFDAGGDAGFFKAGDLIEYSGKRWFPVEITIPQSGFYIAYRTGLREWNTAPDTPSADGRAIYPMKESRELYQPVSVPGAGDNLPEMPEKPEVVKRFLAEIGKMRRSGSKE
jgi:transglutaminase-like putative cysteine protease